MAYTTADLIEAVKSIASIPTSQNLFQTADFLRFANHEMQIQLVPLVMSTREEYFVADHDVAVTANKATYTIPSRAIGGKLRDIQFIDGDTIESLPRLNPDDVTSTKYGRSGFYLQGSSVVLSPSPQRETTLRLKHFRRPNRLVDVTATGKIVSIDRPNNQITVGSAPSTFGTNVLVDFIKGEPSFECVSIDAPITGVSGTTLTFASIPADLAVGDHVALAGESPIPQIPIELHPMLAQMVAVKCLLAQKHSAKSEIEKLAEMKQSALLMLSPRVDGEPQKITNRSGLLGRIRRGW